MKYVYPKFSEIEFCGVRLAGAGLGNLLFIYSKALVYAKKSKRKLIWPTWFSVRIGPWLRNEKDKRTYYNLFKNNSGSISGFKKYLILATKKKRIFASDTEDESADIVLFTYEHMQMNFEELKPYYKLIKDDLYHNLSKSSRKFSCCKFNNIISVHVRLGDFAKPTKDNLNNGKNNVSIPLEWYYILINGINEYLKGAVCFNIYSDGTDQELDSLLKISNVKRVFYGNSIADIFAMAQTKLIIASGSSFSLWARFLGQTSCITYLNQLKASTLISSENGFEIETDASSEVELDSIYRMVEKLYGFS